LSGSGAYAPAMRDGSRASGAIARTLAVAVICAPIAGCAGNEQEQQPPLKSGVAAGRSPATPSAQRRHRTRGGVTVRRSHAQVTCPAAGRVFQGVYHPSRLRLLNSCQRAVGTVAIVRHEEDGDLHIDVALDASYRTLLDAANGTAQHGDLVVEFMARDGGHLPEPHVGGRISLVGAWVDDTQHGWNELHPVWAVSLNGGPAHHSGPRFGGSGAGDRSYDAAENCRTRTGARCTGYGAGSGTDDEPPPTRRPRAPSTRSSVPGSCEPGYSPCLPRVSDLNCNEIPADKKPVRVTGSDPYRLDGDHNGVGCQSG
jgi:hypothetical protein